MKGVCLIAQNSMSGNVNVNVNGGEVDKKGDEFSSCTNCLKFVVTWSLLVNDFLQTLPAPFKVGRRGGGKVRVFGRGGR
ncbi:hypothetical protein HN51_021346 [Arachis hypogaea]